MLVSNHILRFQVGFFVFIIFFSIHNIIILSCFYTHDRRDEIVIISYLNTVVFKIIILSLCIATS